MSCPDRLKILLLNIRYFITGGSDRYLFNLQRLLEARGHEVMVFSANFEQNLPSPYSRYFADPPGHRSQAYYNELELSLSGRVRFSLNTIYSRAAKRKIKELIAHTRPDVAFAVAVQNYLSPSVLDGCREMGVPVVHRISDYGIMCGRYTFLRDGQVCELCYDSIYNAIRYACGGHDVSRAKALVRVAGILFWRYAGTYERSVNVFVTPSRFMKARLVEWGYDQDTIVHIPTFVQPIEDTGNTASRGKRYMLYFGRVSSEKGILTLIKAFANLGDASLELLIAGSSPTSYDEYLREYVSSKGVSGVRFLGHLDRDELVPLIRNALFTVVPSTWYENMPNAVLESFAASRPVIASRIGSIPETVEEGVDGFLFEPGDEVDLSRKMQYLLAHPEHAHRMGKAGKIKATKRYAPEQHYEALMRVFSALLKSRYR